MTLFKQDLPDAGTVSIALQIDGRNYPLNGRDALRVARQLDVRGAPELAASIREAVKAAIYDAVVDANARAVIEGWETQPGSDEPREES